MRNFGFCQTGNYASLGRMQKLPRRFYDRDTQQVAQELLGK